ncbi:sigma-70 family RNA polymerase sigma factor [Kutzneria sp. NPDC051319]|uniref:sigma-70 family RNA polymerase sigma factor n=1 Tax=Kutzneria sp. NPDC051319 TaxID=3155047 RepID=UPI003446FB0B
MQDAQLVGAIVEGDRQGWAELYQRYADPLYTYCVAQLQDRDAAADVLHDTLIVAAERVSQLRDPERLRPWLYAIARNECHRRRRSLRRLVALEEAGDVPAPVEDVDTGLRLDETRRLVRDAVVGLNPSEREVLQLAGSHGLSGPELALALGVSGNHANALLSRARQQFEKSLAALIVARTGREACAVLDDMLHGWDGQLTPLLRKRIARHIENCQTCGENKKRRVNAKQLLTLIPLLAAGAELLEGTTQDIENPELVSYRRDLADRAGTFRRNGFPVGNELWRRPPWITIAAVSTGIAVLSAYAFLAPIQADQKEALPPPLATSDPGSAPPPFTTTGETSTTVTTTEDPTTTATTSRTAAPPKGVTTTGATTTRTTTSTTTTTTTTTTPPTSSSSVPRGALNVTPREIRLDSGKASVTITSKGGPLTWSVSSSNPHVTVSPGGGTLATNGSVTVTVAQTAFDNSGGSTLTFTATGGQSITVSATWTVIS